MPIPVVCDAHDRLMTYYALASVHRCGVDGCGRELTDEDRERLTRSAPEGTLEIRVT
jgi:hypothetical protein